MKKIVVAVLAAVSMAAAASALDLSAGAIFDYSFAHRFGKGSAFGIDYDAKLNTSMLGFKGFFDAQYAVAQIGFNGTVGKTKSEVKASFGGASRTESGDIDLQVGYFNIGIFGKYPFAVGPAKISPMLGFEFDIATSAKAEGHDFPNKEKMNAYWVDAGVGADIFVMKNLFIRPQLLLGFQMNKNDFTAYQTNGIKIDAGIGAGWKF
ncbi:MAG: hypothetical protein ACTTKL_07110 [Treponema sp.]